MPNGRTIAVIVAALSCCSAARAEPNVGASLALPEMRALGLLLFAFAGLAALGRKRRR